MWHRDLGSAAYMRVEAEMRGRGGACKPLADQKISHFRADCVDALRCYRVSYRFSTVSVIPPLSQWLPCIQQAKQNKRYSHESGNIPIIHGM